MIGIDLGGTRIKGVHIDDDGKILNQSVVPTNDDGASSWKKAVLQTISELKTNIQIETLGISAPGLPTANYNAIAHMPGRMEGLENFIWSDYTGINTAVLNDGVAALYAEAKFGAAKGYKHAALLTLGTGVGGALLIDGKPYGGAVNKAGHIGHMVINDSGDKDVTNMPGSLEECIGNCTIEKRSQGKYKSTKELLEAIELGDEFANNIWLKSVRQLAIGLASISNILSPEIIVIGGGIAEANDKLFIPLEKYMSEYEWRAGNHSVKIVKAQFGELAGAIGAACFSHEKYFNK